MQCCGRSICHTTISNPLLLHVCCSGACVVLQIQWERLVSNDFKANLFGKLHAADVQQEKDHCFVALADDITLAPTFQCKGI